MAFSIKIIQKLQEILKNSEFLEKNAIAQKIGFKNDSVDVALDAAEIGKEKIEEQSEELFFSIENSNLATFEITEINLTETVEQRITEAQNQALKALQIEADTTEQSRKAEELQSFNKEVENSIIQTLKHHNVQIGSIPMLFAILSRENDYYGLGNNGVIETSGGRRYLHPCIKISLITPCLQGSFFLTVENKPFIFLIKYILLTYFIKNILKYHKKIVSLQ